MRPSFGSIVTLEGMRGEYRVGSAARSAYDFQAIPTDVKRVYGIEVDSSFGALFSSVTAIRA